MPELRFPEFSGEWEERKLGDVSQITTGKLDANAMVSDGKYRFYTCAKEFFFIDNYSFDTEALLISGNGANVGYIHYYKGKFNAYQRTYVLDDFKKSIIYTKYFLEKHLAKRIAQEKNDGNTPYITLSTLSEMVINFPNLEEQKKLANFFKLIDKKIEKQEEKIASIEDYKRGMMQKLFPKKGENVPELRFKGFTAPWEQRKLGEMVDVCSGRDYKHLSEGDIPVYGTGGYMLSVSEALSFKDDAIGIGRKGTIDKPYILKAPFWTVDTLFYAIPKDGNNLNFIYNIFQNINWKQKDESTGVPSLSKATINNTDILTTGYKEQIKVGEFFSNLDNLITLHKRKLEELKELKKGFMQKMFI